MVGRGHGVLQNMPQTIDDAKRGCLWVTVVFEIFEIWVISDDVNRSFLQTIEGIEKISTITDSEGPHFELLT